MLNGQHSSPVIVRAARWRDLNGVLRLKHALRFEDGNEIPLIDRRASLSRRMLGPQRAFEALVAERAGQLIGMLIYSLKPYTGWPDPAVYVQDFFVEAESRGAGVGDKCSAHWRRGPWS